MGSRGADKQTDAARALADVFAVGGAAPASPTPAAPASPTPAAPASPTPAAPTVAAPASPSARGAAVRSSDSQSAPDAAGAIVLTRAEVDAALADFGRLTAALHGSFSAEGVVVGGVSEGTIFQRVGLRAGDVITAVDGTRLRTLDDAANLYARASTAKALTAQVVRGGAPVALRVVIR
jgi:S1-C subfamily serine protease